DATIALVLARRRGRRTRLFGVATQAARSKEAKPLGRLGPFVGIVTGNAAHLLGAGAFLIAHALMHLLNMIDGLKRLRIVLGGHENRPKPLQRQPGPEIIQMPAPRQQSRRSLEVTLLADCVAQCRFQATRVHDVVFRPTWHMSPAGTMAAFAA